MFFLVMLEKAFALLERNVPKEKVEESSFLWLEKQNLRRKIKRNFSTLGGKRRQMRSEVEGTEDFGPGRS